MSRARMASIGTRKQVAEYCRALQEFHSDGEPWLVFEIPEGTAARRFGEFGCCRASERSVYEAGGAKFAKVAA